MRDEGDSVLRSPSCVARKIGKESEIAQGRPLRFLGGPWTSARLGLRSDDNLPLRCLAVLGQEIWRFGFLIGDSASCSWSLSLSLNLSLSLSLQEPRFPIPPHSQVHQLVGLQWLLQPVVPGCQCQAPCHSATAVPQLVWRFLFKHIPRTAPRTKLARQQNMTTISHTRAQPRQLGISEPVTAEALSSPI